jgi:predicted nucleotidyltransferase
MVSEIEAIRKVLGVLQESGIEYMIVGSYAATLHGSIRTTHDLDLVVRLQPEQVGALASALGDEFYLDQESARRAVERRDMVNAIHMDSGVKIDFWMLHDDEFSRCQFSRRQCVDFEGVPAYVASAEDTILSKLLWYRETPSERQLSDVRGILEVSKDRLDWRYLNDWASRLGLEDLLESMVDG